MVKNSKSDNMSEQQFDTFLKTRMVPRAPSNLSTRIIDQARKDADVQANKPSLGSRLGQFLQGFAIPKPAYVLVASVVIFAGVGAIGIVNIPPAELPSEIYVMFEESDDLALAFYVDDIFEP